MPCTPFTLPGGTRAIVCTRTQRKRCACGQPATIHCDAPTKRKSGTCDRHLCASCATEVGPDLHVCREHATSGFSTAIEAPGPTQQEMF